MINFRSDASEYLSETLSKRSVTFSKKFVKCANYKDSYYKFDFLGISIYIYNDQFDIFRDNRLVNVVELLDTLGVEDLYKEFVNEIDNLGCVDKGDS